MAASPSPLPRRWRVLALVAPSLAFVLVLAAGEIAVRLLLPPLVPLEVFVRDPHQRMDFTDRRHVRIFRFDPELFWRLQPELHDVIWDFTLVSTNAQGLRYPRDLAPRTPGSFRILCVGDSVTFGYRVPVIWADRPTDFDRAARPYPGLIEAYLREHNPGRRIEVIPLAVPGYSSYQGRLWLARSIERLRPDLVTVLFGWNDINFRAAPDATVMRAEPWRVRLRGLVAASQGLLRLTEALRSRETPKPAAGGPWPLRVDREQFVANHLEMQRLARAAGAGFVAIGSVYRDAVEHPDETARLAGHRTALREACAEGGIPYLEIPELTEAGYPGNKLLFGEAIHPNALGHRLLAARLLGFLARHRLLGDLDVGRAAEAGPAGSGSVE